MKFFKDLKTEFFITGSHAYGPLTEDSDLDLVFLPSGSLRVKEYLARLEIPIRRLSGDYVDSDTFYFDIGGLPVNIITVRNIREYYLWKFRTDLMKQLGPIADKPTRIKIFRSLFPDHTGEILKSEISDTPAVRSQKLSIPANPLFPEPPRVDGFTFSEWESVNPNFALIALSMPKFAPFHALIQGKAYNQAMRAPVL